MVIRATLAVLIGILAFPAPGQAQAAPDRAAILAAVNNFFGGMKARDTVMMASVTHPGATIAAAEYPSGEVRIGGGVAADQFPGIAAMSESPNERYLASEVWQDGDIATVWGPYEISLGARTLHCGYDAFNMVRVNGAWQFAGALYSARPDGCPAIRAAAKAPAKPKAAERAEVMKAVERFFTAMRSRDSAGLANGFTSRANWVTVAYREGKSTVSRRAASADVGRMARSQQDLDERFLQEPVVRMDGDIAVVWGYYQFKVGGKVSHCGYDSFHMLKEDGVWRIEGGIYTVRPDGCK
jgi:hypothetical protein